MLILGIDTATRVCGAALMKDNILLAESVLNTGKTHSRQLMPMIDGLFRQADIAPDSIAGIGVAAGPGSFTGLRIGVSTARALAQGYNVPAVGVSSLQALAAGIMAAGALICPVLDARRDQVYAAVYRRSEESAGHNRELFSAGGTGGKARGQKEAGSDGLLIFDELMEPAPVSVETLAEFLLSFTEPVYFPGDALERFRDYFRAVLGDRFREPHPPLAINRASSVAYLAGLKLAKADNSVFNYHNLRPEYLRQPEAIRKQEEKNTGTRG